MYQTDQITYQEYVVVKGIPSQKGGRGVAKEGDCMGHRLGVLDSVQQEIRKSINLKKNVHQICQTKYISLHSAYTQLQSAFAQLQKKLDASQRFNKGLISMNKRLNRHNLQIGVQIFVGKVELQRLCQQISQFKQRDVIQKDSIKQLNFQNTNLLSSVSSLQQTLKLLQSENKQLRIQLSTINQRHYKQMQQLEQQTSKKLRGIKRIQQYKLKKFKTQVGIKIFLIKAMQEMTNNKYQNENKENIKLREEVDNLKRQLDKQKQNGIYIVDDLKRSHLTNMQFVQESFNSTKTQLQFLKQRNSNLQTQLSNQVKHWKSKYQDLLLKFNNLENEYDNLKRMHKKIQGDFSMLVQERDQMKIDLDFQKKRLKEITEKYSGVDGMLEELNRRIKVLQGQVARQQKLNQGLLSQQSILKKSILEKDDLISSLNLKIRSLDQKLADLQAQIIRLQKQKCQLQNLTEDIKRKNRLLQGQKIALTAKVNQKNKQITQLQNRNGQLQRLIAQIKIRVRQLERQIDDLNRRQIGDPEQIYRLSKLCEELSKRIVYLQNQHKCLTLFYKQRVKQVDYWKLAYHSAGIEDLRAQIIRLKSLNEENKIKQANWKGVLQQLQAKMKGLCCERQISKGQISRLNELLLKKIQQSNQLSNQIYSIQDQSIVSLSRIKDLQNQLYNLKKVKDPILQQVDQILFRIQLPKTIRQQIAIQSRQYKIEANKHCI